MFQYSSKHIVVFEKDIEVLFSNKSNNNAFYHGLMSIFLTVVRLIYKH